MPCFKPLFAIRPPEGGRLLFSNAMAAQHYQQGQIPLDLGDKVTVPCGKCIGCRLEKSRQWAVRCMHEASLYDLNCFLTLTYDDDHLPEGSTLVPSHLELFMKRLRKKFVTAPASLDEIARLKWLEKHKIRFYACGEYGDLNHRPHYHVCIFNFDFPDKLAYGSSGDNTIYASDILDELWGFGHCIIGDVTFDSAAYVARYCTKVISGEAAAEHYKGRYPEFARMSRNPGIGRAWIDRFEGDVYPRDEVVVNGCLTKPPRYYDSVFSDESPEVMEIIKDRRAEKALRKDADESSASRLLDREKCATARVKMKFKQLEF